MPYAPKDYARLIGMSGFSEALMKNHFTLYQGYVASTNKVLDALDAMLREGRTAAPEYAELKRRLGWEFNGMRLHELYFGNLGGGGGEAPAGKVRTAIERDFGSFDAWLKDFRAVGSMRGIGWAVLYLDPDGGRLINSWINEHDVSHPAGCVPLLVMDVFEHAFITDYGLKRADYLNAFLANVDWEAVERRAG